MAATLTTITALRNFDIIYNTTAGGPGGETEVPSWLMFHNAFDYSRVGFAASIAVVLDGHHHRRRAASSAGSRGATA